MDNRNTPRNQLLVYLDVLERDSGKHLGYLGDISTSGLMFISQQRWTVGDRLRVRIPLEEEQMAMLSEVMSGSSFGDQYIDGEVEVRWAKPNINAHFQCFGCVFTRVDQAQFALIDSVAKHLGVDDRVLLSRVQ